MESRNTEQNKIKQVAKDYEKKGYSVIIEPRGNNIPSFIKNYQPDLIAKSEKDNVIVEVKSRADLATIDKFKDLAETVSKKENWRFELIVTTYGQGSVSKRTKINNEQDISEIKKGLKDINKLEKHHLFTAAFILSWGILESLARQLLMEDRKNLNNKSSLTLIKTLFSLGYLTRADYEQLNELFQLRNTVVHGYKSDDLNNKATKKITTIIKKLILEKENFRNT